MCDHVKVIHKILHKCVSRAAVPSRLVSTHLEQGSSKRQLQDGDDAARAVKSAKAGSALLGSKLLASIPSSEIRERLAISSMLKSVSMWLCKYTSK